MVVYRGEVAVLLDEIPGTDVPSKLQELWP